MFITYIQFPFLIIILKLSEKFELSSTESISSGCISIGSYADALKCGLKQRGIDSKMSNKTSQKQNTSVFLKHSKGRDETNARFRLEKGSSEYTSSYKEFLYLIVFVLFYSFLCYS